MIAIARDMDEYDIAQEIRFERAVHKGSFLLVEGDTDVKRFGVYIDERACSIVNCYGKANALGATKILYDEGILGALALIDADFDRLVGGVEAHEGIIYSETHDFDLDWVRAHTVQKYLAEVGDAERISFHGGASEIIGKILIGLKPVSVARFLQRSGRIRYKLSNVDISSCFEAFSVSVERYVDLIIQTNGGRVERGPLISQINAISRGDFDLQQITNGHDFHCALGASLRNELGARRDVHTWGSEVEIHLRLCFSDKDFVSSYVYGQIRSWQNENLPFQILSGRFK